jgi:hypothetical protein
LIPESIFVIVGVNNHGRQRDIKMRPDYVDWDEPDDPQGNVWHIMAADLTPREVEDVLDDPDGAAVPSDGAAEGTERWIVFGWTSTGSSRSQWS